MSRSGCWHSGWAAGAIDPSLIANLAAWYDLESEGYSDAAALGAAATKVHDRSGNGLDLTQSAVGQRPVYKTGIAGGKAVMRTVAANFSELNPASFPLGASSPAEQFIVLRPLNDPALAACGPVGSYASGGHQFPRTNGIIEDCFGTSNVQSVGDPAFSLSGAFSVYNPCVALTAGGGQLFHLNGVLMASQATVAAIGWAASLRIGGNNDGWWSGDIAEYILYSRKLSTPERHGVTLYLGSKYGISVV